jgi:hypothetical protein
MTDSAVRARRHATRAEYLDEETEAAEGRGTGERPSCSLGAGARCSRRDAEGACGRGTRPDVGLDPPDSGARRTGGYYTSADRGTGGGDSAAGHARVGLRWSSTFLHGDATAATAAANATGDAATPPTD